MAVTKVILAFALVFIGLEISVYGERVLIFFPLSSKSMANLFEPLTRGLIEREHEVKIVTPSLFKIDSTNLTQIQPATAEQIFSDYPEPFSLRKQNKLFRFPLEFQLKFCHKLYQMEEISNLAKEKFDVIIANIIYHDCFSGIFHKIGSPIIWLGSLPLPSAMTEFLGNPAPSSFIPNCFLRDISESLTFAQRTKNFLYNAYFNVMLELWTRKPLEPLYREYLGQNVPSVVEIYTQQTGLLFMNAHFTVTYPRPLLPSVVEIGGIHCRSSRPLPKDLEEFVEGAKDGFIVFSMGSILRAAHMPESVRLAFVKAFGKLKQRVVWKWEKDGGMDDLPDNVKLVKWIPQQDLLGHPNIKLFITHGGLLSTEEAVWHGVPVLGFPVFVDQDANMKHAEGLGFGVKGEILDLTEAKLTPNIRRILDDQRYMKKVKELSKIFRDQPQTPLDRALYWTEYVMRHKGAYHLRSSAMNLNMIQFYSVDVIAFLVGVTVSLILIVYYAFKLTLRLISNNNERKKYSVKRKRM